MWTWIKLLFFKPKSITELAKTCSTPKKIGLWMWQHITYKGDMEKWGKSDYWQSAEVTFKDKSGDCEDYSVLAYEVLKLNGLAPYLLGVWGYTDSKYSGHAICVICWQNTWYHVSNWGCRKTKATCLDEVPKYLYQRVVYAREFTNEGKSLRLITFS